MFHVSLGIHSLVLSASMRRTPVMQQALFPVWAMSIPALKLGMPIGKDKQALSTAAFPRWYTAILEFTLTCVGAGTNRQ